MPQFERGVYEPPEDVRVFDGGTDDGEDEGSRLPLLIVIALVVLAAFAGVVWLAYSQGVQHGREVAPRVVASGEAPAKTGEIPFKGLKIYQQPAPADEGAADEDTAPPPPSMVAPKKPTVLSQSQAAAGVPLAHVPFATGLRARSGMLRPTAPSAESATETPSQQTATETPPPATAAPLPLAPLKAKTEALPVVPKKVATAPAPATSTERPAHAKGAGGFVLQVGAYKSDAEARAAWHAYEAKHPVVGGYEPDIRRVELAGKGTWFRLRIGAFANSSEAATLCEKLKADGATCFPAKR
jgi:cell division septation protein DedD